MFCPWEVPVTLANHRDVPGNIKAGSSPLPAPPVEEKVSRCHLWSLPIRSLQDLVILSSVMTSVSSKDFPTMRMDILPNSIWIEMIQQKPGAMISLKREEILIIFFGIAFLISPLLPASFCLFVCRARRGCRVALWRSWLQCCVLEAATLPVQWVWDGLGSPPVILGSSHHGDVYVLQVGGGHCSIFRWHLKRLSQGKASKRPADAVFAWRVIVGGLCI